MAPSNCLAANTLLPLQRWALPCSICDINPFLSQRDSAWHEDNARFLGTKYWRGLNKERDLSLSLLPHRYSPSTPSTAMDKRQVCAGVFFFLKFVVFLVCATNDLTLSFVGHTWISYMFPTVAEAFRSLSCGGTVSDLACHILMYLCWISHTWKDHGFGIWLLFLKESHSVKSSHQPW